MTDRIDPVAEIAAAMAKAKCGESICTGKPGSLVKVSSKATATVRGVTLNGFGEAVAKKNESMWDAISAARLHALGELRSLVSRCVTDRARGKKK